MVSTRRNTANASRIVVGIKNPKVTKSTGDTIHVAERPRKKAKNIAKDPETHSIPPSTGLSKNISDHDISLTSPITDNVSMVPTAQTPKTKTFSPSPPNRTVSPALRRLAPKPFGRMSGGYHDPIVVNEDSSPPRPIQRAPKRKTREERPPELHRLTGNGYRDLYNYGARRPGVARLPSNRSTRNSRQSHDIYQTMNVRMVEAPKLNPSAFPERDAFTVPFQMQHPLPMQTLAYQQIQSNFPMSYAQYHRYPAPPMAHFRVPLQSEGILRNKVVEYTREFLKASPPKQRPSHTDPDETGSWDIEQPAIHHEFSREYLAQMSGYYPLSSPRIGFYTRSGPKLPRDHQSNLNVHRLIEHSSLISSLLQAYQYPNNQHSLREDIRTMLLIQHHDVTVWLDSESRNTHTQKESSKDSAVGLDVQRNSVMSISRSSLNDDDEVRRVFSASADIWQDGTGNSVADIFGTQYSSSHNTKLDAKVASSGEMMSTSAQQSKGTKGKSNGNIARTPLKRVQKNGTSPTLIDSSPHTSLDGKCMEKICNEVTTNRYRGTTTSVDVPIAPASSPTSSPSSSRKV
jgi:hypothetical protein